MWNSFQRECWPQLTINGYRAILKSLTLFSSSANSNLQQSMFLSDGAHHGTVLQVIQCTLPNSSSLSRSVLHCTLSNSSSPSILQSNVLNGPVLHCPGLHSPFIHFLVPTVLHCPVPNSSLFLVHYSLYRTQRRILRWLRATATIFETWKTELWRNLKVKAGR